MSEYIEIKFKGQRTAIFENPSDFELEKGEFVLVEAEKGFDFGKVNYQGSTKPETTKKNPVRKILRKSKTEDFLKQTQNRINEKKALDSCRKKVAYHKLQMKLVDCEYQFDGNKITFYFTAERRVDFRRLVKDLAGEHRTRIELRQIGVRDEAKRLGGYGVCGRKLCCSSWLREFQPITTQAARDQNLPLNPSKLAGVCGRLKCCLMYERDFYNWAIKQYPELAKDVKTSKGWAMVERIDIFQETVQLKYRDGATREVLPLAELKDNMYKCKNNCGHEHGNLEDLKQNPH